MKELNKFELASIKRTYANTKALRAKKARLEEKVKALQEEADIIGANIDTWEEPVKQLTEGYTSEQVLSGQMDINNSLEEAKEVSISSTETPYIGSDLE